MSADLQEIDEPDPISVAVTAQYLYLGMDKERLTRKGDPFPSVPEGDSGHIGVTYRIAHLAQVIERYVLTLAPENYPGVFEYEIVEEIGGWWYDNSMCTDGEFMAELHIRCTKWWAEPEQPETRGDLPHNLEKP